jgi:molybdopterin converting factor small subunit
MIVTIRAFGQVAEITQKTTWEESRANSLQELKTILLQDYPALSEIPMVFSMNHQICGEDILLKPMAEIGIMPPFSGG